jgi:predicted Zn-dependent protease
MDQIGRYKIEAEIGHGGFGRVYRAFDPNFSRHVAIKVLSAGADKDLLTRFRNEAIAVGKLQHKNIVIVHDFGQIGDTPYLVMEYLEGHDLQKALRSRRPMNLLEKITIMDQVAAGLHHAHRNGIVHRDVKPGNVMILKDGSVKMMDFGIARLVQDRGTRVTQHGNVIGTVQYMAPEQFRGGDVDSRCDVFAYGVIYYELITGHHPFDAPDMPRIFYNVTMVDPAPVRSLAPECPAALEEIITKTLQKDPEFRYQTLEDVLFDVAPIRLALERDFGQSLVRKAERLFSESNVAEAQQVIREALQFDPNNSDARHIRERIQRHAERVAGRERARQLVEAGRRDVVKRDFDKALEQFESARRVDTDNPEIEQLIASVRRELEKAERAAMLLAKARNEFEARDITGAYQDVLECLQCQPDSAEAKALLGSIRREIERRERERRFAEAISRVESHHAAGEYDQALTLLGDLDVSYPGSPKVQELIRSATEAKQEKERKERIAQALDRARKLVSEANWRDAVGVLERVQNDQKPELAVQSLLAYCREELTAQEKAAEVESAIREARKLSDALDFPNAISRIERSLAKYPDEPALRAAHDRTVAARRTHERNQAINTARSRAAEHVGAKQYGKAITLLDEAIVNWPARELIELKEQIERQWRDHQRNELVMATIADSTKLLENGRSEEAASVLRRVLASYPGEAQVTKHLAEIEARIGEEKRQRRIAAVLSQAAQLAERADYRRALDGLARAEQELGRDPRIASAIAEISGKRTAARQGEIEALRRQGKYDQALSAAEAALREFGREDFRRLRDELQEQLKEQRRREGIDAACADAERYSNSGDLSRAITCLEGAEEAYGRDSRIESALSEYRDRLGQQQRAAAVQSIVSSATSLLRRDDFQPALKIIREGLYNYPEEPMLATLMSRVTAEQSEFNRRRGIKVALDRVRELKQKREFEQAEEALQRALRTLTDEPELLAELEVVRRSRSTERSIAEAQQCLTNGDIAGARASIERAAASAADDVRVHALQEQIRSAADEQARRERIAQTLAEARTLTESDKAEAALGLLQQALDRDPQEAQLRSFKAYVEETIKAQQRERDIAHRIHASRELIQSGSYSEAISAIEAALKFYPDEPALSGLLGRAREQQAAENQAALERSIASVTAARAREEFETALDLLNTALQVHPNESSLLALREKTNEERSAAEVRRKAEEALKAAAAQRERDIAGRIHAGRELIQSGSYSEAISALEAALGVYPDEAALLGLLAKAREQQATEKQADLERSLTSANAARARGEFETALNLLNTALRLYPNDSSLLALRQRTIEEKSAAEARRSIEESLKAAAVHRAARRFSDAVKVLTSARERFPENTQLGDMLAVALQEQAGELKRTAIDTALASSDREASRGKYAAALQILEAALKQYPADPVLTERRQAIEADQREHEIEAALRQANEHVRNGKHAAGIKLLESSLGNYPDNRLTAALADVRRQKAQVERRNAAAAAARNADAALKRNDPDAALKIVSAALIDAPGDAALLQAKSRIESALLAQSRRRDVAALNTLVTATRKAQDRSTVEEIADKIRSVTANYTDDDEIKTAAAQADAAVRAKLRELEKPAVVHATNGAPAAERIETASPAGPEVSRPPVRVSPEPKPVGSRKGLLLGAGVAAAGLVVAFVTLRPKTTEVLPPEPQPQRRVEPAKPEPSALPPKVLRFAPNRTTAAPGQPVEICYGVENVKSLRIDPPIHSVEPAASRCFSFAPKTAGEYTLIAVGNNGEEISQKFRIDISDAPVVKPGTLVVQVAEGTTVTVSGRRYVADRSNSVTVPLERGQYAVGAEREGYAVVPPRMVRIEPERTEKLAFALTPIAATLSIAGVPPGTSVAVDNRTVGTIQGTGSFQIQPGKHSVQLTSNGFQPKRVDIDAQPGATVTLGPPAVSMVRTEPVPPPVDAVAVARQRWEQLQSSRDIGALEEFRRSNPGQFGDNAARRIEQLEWDNARAAKNVAPVRAFLAKYPSSQYTDEAKQMLQQLEWGAVDRNDLSALKAYVQRVPNGPFTQQAIAEIKRLEAAGRSAADLNSVTETLNRVSAAYAAKDFNKLAEVWPNAPRELRNMFKDVRSISFVLTPVPPISLSGDNGSVVCRRTVTTVFPDKKSSTENDQVTVRLQRSGNGWQVMAIQ